LRSDTGSSKWGIQAETGLRWLVLGVSSFVMLLFVVTALERVRYPYELEELEGYVFLTALRAFHGQAIYPHPSLAFIPYMYPPLYYYVCAALGKVAGMSISTMRLVSILSTLGCFAAVATLVGTEGPGQRGGMRRFLPAIAAAGLYAGCYTVCGEWFDLGRLDSFFVFLVLLAMLATRRAHPVFAAVLWTLAFQTKQSILPAAFIMLCHDWPADWRRNGRRVRRILSGLSTLVVGAAGSVAWLNHVSDGWYQFIVFAVPRANADIKLRKVVVFWPEVMLRPLGLALIVIAAAAVFTRPSLRSRATRFYLAACSLVLLFWWIWTHGGSTGNAPMPIYALVAVLFGIALARLLVWLPGIGPLEPRWGRAAVLLLLLAALVQEAAAVYNPGDFRPSTEVRRSIQAVIAEARELPGDVYVTQHPYYGWLAGKPVHADLVSISDAEHVEKSPIPHELQTELQTMLAQHPYTAIMFESPASIDELDQLARVPDQQWMRYYDVRKDIPGVVQGTRPDWVVVHCPAGSSPICAP
jgi:hypothetical protein